MSMDNGFAIISTCAIELSRCMSFLPCYIITLAHFGLSLLVNLLVQTVQKPVVSTYLDIWSNLPMRPHLY